MTAIDLRAYSLAQLAEAVRADRLPLELVREEWDRRKACGLDPFTNAPPCPPTASPAVVPAIACPNCGSLSRAPIAPGDLPTNQEQSCR